MERRRIVVHGLVQGVGFRPFVHRLASRLHLTGLVMNRTGGVRIEVEGEAAPLDQFLSRLVAERPMLSRIDRVTWEGRPALGDQQFHIEGSQCDSEPVIAVCPDAAICDDCLRELYDPADRRYRYPFLNCVNCGPRLTVVTGVPYDRQRTTLAAFPMCAACRAEFDDPASRRFHGQATTCPACGPHIWATDQRGEPLAGDPLRCFAAALAEGRIGALKGMGGYHLVCDARSAAAVAELRRRKGRADKPLAVMVRDVAAAEAVCEIDAIEREQLRSWRRAIVLLRKKAGAGLADAIAAGHARLGLMLPYTALHQLLLDAAGDRPLIMTSGNRSEEPIACDNEDAQVRLKDIADIFIHHNLAIHVRCDDSVTQVAAGHVLPVRRSRGYAPQPIGLPVECAETLLALGGQLKVTFGIGRGSWAILSHHIGDLDSYEAYRQFEADIKRYERLYEVRPRWLVHDLHPDYASTRYALRRQAEDGSQVVAVQHHHAHLASCLADNGSGGRVIGVVFDGAGLGSDGTIWGGEFLIGDLAGFRRAGHLRPVAMPGGEAAIREPWRMAASHLADAGLDLLMLKRGVPADALRVIGRMLEGRINAPLTSSAGRLFDAVAALAGVRDRVSYEGQAAMELEQLATTARADGRYDFTIEEAAGDDAPLVVDIRPMIRQIVRDARAGAGSSTIARRFHSTLVEVIGAVCVTLRRRTGLSTVALSGGVFGNALLMTEAAERLMGEGFEVLRHRAVPPNDGGLSLGQLAIAAARIKAGDAGRK